MVDSLSLFLAYYMCTHAQNVTKDMNKPSKELWNKQIEEVIRWVESKNYKVVFNTDEEDRLCFDSKTIFINSRKHPETKYYTLLHEAGHLLISQSWKSFENDMPMYATSSDGRKERGKSYLVSLLAEEIEAWKRGRRLSGKLKHFINNDKYDRHITESVSTYVMWASDCMKR